MAEANVGGADAKLVEVRAGVKRADAELNLWQAQTERVQGLVNGRAATGQLLDETKNKLRSAEAACAEIDAKVMTAEVAVLQSHAARDQAHSDFGAAAAWSRSPRKTPGAAKPFSATARSKPLSMASSYTETSTPAT